MKLKIYLRGLGIGIAVTTLILGVSYSGKKEMTDAEVIARAKELGMVEGETESGKLYEGIDAQKIESEVYSTEERESELQTESETLELESEFEEDTTQPIEVLNGNETEQQTDMNAGEEMAKQIIEVTIVSGDDSATASRRLQEAGVVESATTFDKYLCSNGYSKKVVSGTYKIAVGSDDETIAKIITKSE